MLTLSEAPAIEIFTAADAAPEPTDRLPFLFIAERLWLDFVNSESGLHRLDALRDFETMTRWMEAAEVLDNERIGHLRRRAIQQPAGASAALLDARRVRSALRALAERGAMTPSAREEGVAEINRVLGRSAGTRRVELRRDGTCVRTFIPVGDAFAGLVMAIVESAADALVFGELTRVRRCASAKCARVFYDSSKNGRRRWCDMMTCGNRAKAQRFRDKLKV